MIVYWEERIPLINSLVQSLAYNDYTTLTILQLNFVSGIGRRLARESNERRIVEFHFSVFLSPSGAITLSLLEAPFCFI